MILFYLISTSWSYRCLPDVTIEQWNCSLKSNIMAWNQGLSEVGERRTEAARRQVRPLVRTHMEPPECGAHTKCGASRAGREAGDPAACGATRASVTA